MWIFDSYHRGCVELWGKEHGLSRVSIGYPPSFYLHLKDPCHLYYIIFSPVLPSSSRRCWKLKSGVVSFKNGAGLDAAQITIAHDLTRF